MPESFDPLEGMMSGLQDVGEPREDWIEYLRELFLDSTADEETKVKYLIEETHDWGRYVNDIKTGGIRGGNVGELEEYEYKTPVLTHVELSLAAMFSDADSAIEVIEDSYSGVLIPGVGIIKIVEDIGDHRAGPWWTVFKVVRENEPRRYFKLDGWSTGDGVEYDKFEEVAKVKVIKHEWVEID